MEVSEPSRGLAPPAINSHARITLQQIQNSLDRMVSGVMRKRQAARRPEPVKQQLAARLSPEDTQEAVSEAAKFLGEKGGLGDDSLRYGPVGRETTRLIALTRRHLRIGPYRDAGEVPDEVAREVESKLSPTIMELRRRTITSCEG
jgi:hypothetical protein